MARPLLQIALDNLTIEDAIEDVEKVKDYIDIIEIGTILISSKGVESIKKISDKYPDKIIVADGKIADAGSVFAKMFFDNGADFTTCICAAETSTIASVQEIAKTYGANKDTQIELTTNFTWNQAKSWREVGIKQAVWHRSRDAQAAGVNWSQNDLDAIRKLIDMGFKVTVTGGITVKDVEFFKDLPIYIFIAGRSIRDAANPTQAVQEFQEAITKHYG